MSSPWYIFLLALLANAQSCENYGSQNGSSCACPVGFGGSTCSEVACGGDIFQGSQRPLTTTSSSFANLTASGCSCEEDWTGTGCNVCQSSNACQVAYTASGNAPPTPDIISGSQGGQNNTLTCNTTPRVWASSQMSCRVDNPTLQAIYPLASTLNIIRTLQPSLTPLPNITAFGAAGSAYAQLFYAGVEQFYCHADSCTQSIDNGGSSADWSCQNLQCTCRVGTTFCGEVASSNLTNTINALSGTLEIACGVVDSSTNTATCHFKQATLQGLFGASGLALNGCSFGECVRQNVIDNNGNSTDTSSTEDTSKSLSGGVIAGLAVVGGLVLLALALLLLGFLKQRKAQKIGLREDGGMQVGVEWDSISYTVPGSSHSSIFSTLRKRPGGPVNINDDKVVLDNVAGKVQAGQIMAILGPSGAGKTTLVEILAGKSKSGIVTGKVKFPTRDGHSEAPRIGFVPQQDVLPPTLTVYEALLFAARLRLPENILDLEKRELVDELMAKLGISSLRDVRIGYSGDVGGGKARGISGGEMRRVSIGLELISRPDVLILDEPTSGIKFSVRFVMPMLNVSLLGLDSVSASRIAKVLHDIAHDPVKPIPVIASIHQPSSQLYQSFDSILLLSHGRALYSGPGLFAPSDYFTTAAPGVVPPYPQGYNVADYLLEVATDPHVSLFQLHQNRSSATNVHNQSTTTGEMLSEKAVPGLLPSSEEQIKTESEPALENRKKGWATTRKQSKYATAFLTQLQVLSGREWKILRRDKTLFFTHVVVSAVLGVFCGGLYYHTDTTIAGFQSRVGCLFFLGALIAFSSLSALYNVVEIRPLFLRERSSMYYSPTAWLLSRFIFDAVPLRLIPTIIVSTITYWMAGLAPDAAHFFKFLFILVLYTLAMTLFNFLLGTMFHNGGIAILLSALSALYQMTYAGFFVHLDAIPPVLRWLQWLCPLKYTLEALSVNEVGSGLLIEDVLQGVPVSISASLIMQLLFGFGLNNYYRDVLVLFAYIVGFGVGVIGVVWLKVRERR
ncbi:putative ATP-dependent permease [Hypsizygus marmoreus]|uniref:ATP-dependent permease n=1 Tax=Hypsizygus marmoreus TaxID=39966 RepID=A0A369JUE4_HYPMA|nr:putative ATP-dependent permease [Hypsizygus marmoreus]